MVIDTKAGSDPPPTVIKEANCVGTEESISQCPQDNSHICLNLGAGVICPQPVKGNNHLLFNDNIRQCSFFNVSQNALIEK